MKLKFNCCNPIRKLIQHMIPCGFKSKTSDKDTRNTKTNTNGHEISLENSSDLNEADQNSIPSKETLKNLGSSQINVCTTNPTNPNIFTQKAFAEAQTFSIDFSEDERPAFSLDMSRIESLDHSPIQKCLDCDSFMSEFNFSSRARSPIKELIKNENISAVSHSGSSVKHEPLNQNYLRIDTPDIVHVARKMPKLPPLTPDLFQIKGKQLRRGFKFVPKT